MHLLRPGGQCGIVIPSGVYTDLGAKGLRELLFHENQITGLVGFENRKSVFEGVDSRFKFVVLTFARGGSTRSFPAAFMRLDVRDLADFPGEIGTSISIDLVRRLSPDSLSIVELRSSEDLAIVDKLYRYPLLGEDLPDTWNLNLGREFHMTDDRGLFEVSPSDGHSILYEGKMIWQFDPSYEKPRYWVPTERARDQLRALLCKRLTQAIQSASGLTAAHASGLFRASDLRLDHEVYRLAFRDVASSTNERTMIAAILPRDVFAGNTLNLAMPWRLAADHGTWRQVTTLAAAEMLYLAACLNSFVVDWMLRQKVTAHLNQFYVYQIPVPRLAEDNRELLGLAGRAARLSCTSPEFDDLAREVGLQSHRDGSTDPDERAGLRAELDGLVAHLYGLTETEFAHILSTFPLVPEPVKVAALNAWRDVERGLIR